MWILVGRSLIKIDFSNLKQPRIEDTSSYILLHKNNNITLDSYFIKTAYYTKLQKSLLPTSPPVVVVFFKMVSFVVGRSRLPKTPMKMMIRKTLDNSRRNLQFMLDATYIIYGNTIGSDNHQLRPSLYKIDLDSSKRPSPSCSRASCFVHHSVVACLLGNVETLGTWTFPRVGLSGP